MSIEDGTSMKKPLDKKDCCPPMNEKTQRQTQTPRVNNTRGGMTKK